MFQQIATTSRSAALIHGFNEPGVVFEHPVNGFFDELGGVLAGASGEVASPEPTP